MGAQGTTTVNFGTFPGSYDTSVAVTGQAAIVGGSLCEAWLFPTATADHSADEHLLEPIKVIAGNVSAGVGFTIWAFNESDIIENRLDDGFQQSPTTTDNAGAGSAGTLLSRVGRTGRNATTTVAYQDRGGYVDNPGKIAPIYGQFTVAWVWN